jgi:hypothetical protein
MPTFRQDPKLGTMVPLMKTDDYNDQSVTEKKLKDGNITTRKLADCSVTTAKIADGNVTTQKIADQNVTTGKLQDSGVTTEKIADLNVTTEKLDDKSVTTEKMADGSVSNEKLQDDSITNEKLAENSITKDKLKDNTIGVEKLDPELRQTINAATGLPENLVETIQNVDDTLKDHQKQLDDKQSQIDDKQQQITANDEDISLLQTRSTQIEETIKSIAATGGASQATAVTYNNEKSKLTAINIQSAVDEIVEKTAIKDEEGLVVETPFRYIQNEEFIFAKVDVEDKLLFGIQWDGTPVFGKTSAVEDRLQSQVTLLSDKVTTILGDDDTTSAIDTLKELKDFFASIDNTQTLTSILTNLNSVSTKLGEDIKNLQDTKVDKEEGKSLIENEVKECFRVIENEEFLKAIVDSEDKVLFGFYRATGKPYYPLNEMYHVEQNEEFFAVWLDAANHILLGIRRDGQIIGEIHAVNALKQVISQLQSDLASLKENVGTIDTNLKELLDVFSLQDNPEFIYAKTDADGKVIEGLRKDGTRVLNGYTEFSGNIKALGMSSEYVDNPEFIYVKTDKDGKVIEGLRKDGTRVINKFESNSIPTNKDIISTVVGSKELSDKIACGDILSLYPIRSEKPVLANFKYHTVESGPYIKPKFTLLYFSDLHSVSRRLERIIKYYNQYKEYIDDIVSTGDANNFFTTNFSFWKENGAGCILNALGNHEVFGGSREYELSEEDNQSNIVKKYIVAYNVPTYSSKECYDKFIKPYLSETKINSVENKCYFYKDYESAKIRIIALDVYHWRDVIYCKKEYADGHTESYTSESFPDGDTVDKGEQADWFKNILEDSRQKGFNVICMIHTQKIDTLIDCTFTNLDRPSSSYYGDNNNKEYSDLVEAFMADHDDEYGAGKFICWLCGHHHSDAIGLSSNYPKQLKILIDTAGCSRNPNNPQFDFTGNFDRIENTYSDDLFDIFAVDTEHKYISLHRVGCHSDSHGRHIGNLLYDYKNMKLLYNN